MSRLWLRAAAGTWTRARILTITRHRNFNVGNAIKYLWRAGLKTEFNAHDDETQIQDLRKAVWYINDEIQRLETT